MYTWVKNRKDESFEVRALVGGENYNWEGTPLQVLYEKHVDNGKYHQAAVEAAARDIGWLTKAVLSEDKRTFEMKKVGGKVGPTNSYRWIGNEP